MTGVGFAAIVARIARSGCRVCLLIAPVVAVGPDIASAAPVEQISDCLKSPKGTAPAGERWYYRVERGSNRHCWYSRAGAPSHVARQVAPKAEATRAPDATAPAPLELSVANARAEADLSAAPQPAAAARGDGSLPVENNGWTLAERWSDHRDVRPPAELLPVQTTPPAAPLIQSEDLPHESLLEMAAGTIALLGLSLVLTAVLIRRRKRNGRRHDGHFAGRFVDGSEIRPSLTDLNDEPLMTWRKAPREALRMERRSGGQHDAASGADQTPIPTHFAAPRRTPTTRPDGRA